MKQELESILSFGAQAVSGEKTIFDQAALRHLDRLMEGNSGYKTIPANPAVLSQELREGTAQNGQCRRSISSTPASENCSSSATQATSSVTLPWAAQNTP